MAPYSVEGANADTLLWAQSWESQVGDITRRVGKWNPGIIKKVAIWGKSYPENRPRNPKLMGDFVPWVRLFGCPGLEKGESFPSVWVPIIFSGEK